jgi:1,4-dihydroxy-2-naphthoate octaprenyltransferase
MLVLATIAASPLLYQRGWPIVAIGLPSLYFCFGYTGGPWPLAYRGLGEVFVILFFGLVAVTGTFFVQTGLWHWNSLWVGLQMGCLSTVLIAINNLRDAEEDRSSGKRTLAVRFGESFARIEIALLCLLPHLLGLIVWGRNALGLWPLGALPLSVFIAVKACSGLRGKDLNGLLAIAGAQLLLYALLFALACIRS